MKKAISKKRSAKEDPARQSAAAVITDAARLSKLLKPESIEKFALSATVKKYHVQRRIK